MSDSYLRSNVAETAEPDAVFAKAEEIKQKVDERLRGFSLDPGRHGDLQRFIARAHAILLSPDAKRIRCILPVLIGEALELDEESCLKFGLIVELLHYASLIHDDVIDGDQQRRGCRTLNSVFSNSQAVLIGDFMLCAVIDYSLGFDNSKEVIRLLIDGVKNLVTGIIIEQAVIVENPTYEKYREMALLKTGSLFALSFGLPLVGTPNLGKGMQCGALLGFLFQVYDDYLDRDKDAPHHNIFRILSQKEIVELWERDYRTLVALAGELGLRGVVADAIVYLRSVGCLLEIDTPKVKLFAT